MSEDELMFLEAIVNLHLLKGESLDFVCPICKSTAHASRVKSNGHIHANCTKCDLRISS